jgi:hypothetical protein
MMNENKRIEYKQELTDELKKEVVASFSNKDCYQFSDTYMRMIFPRSVVGSDQVSDQEDDQESNYVSNQESNDVSNQESNDVGNQESDHSMKVLKYCLMPKTRKSILKEIGLSNQTKNYKKHIEPLITKEQLQMTIPDNPKNRNQKYITTQKGKEKLNS